MKRYTVRARRIGRWWALDVDGAPGVHTQVRRIDQAEAMARDAISGVLDIAPDSFEVVVAPEVPTTLRTLVDEATAAGIDLLKPDEFPTIKRFGLACTMTSSHPLANGLCDPKFHGACLEAMHASIEATALLAGSWTR